MQKDFFQKFQTKPQKHIKSKVAVKNNSYFFEIIRARSLVVSIMAYSYTEKHLLVAVLFYLIVKHGNLLETSKVKFTNSFFNNLLGYFRNKKWSSMRTWMWHPRSFSVAIPNVFVLENKYVLCYGTNVIDDLEFIVL